MDIRTFGLLEGDYYWKSQEESKVKYIKARIAEVTSDGKRLLVKGEDTLVKRPITIPFDMVVHAIGMDPNVDNMTLSAVFDVELNRYGYIDKAASYVDAGRDHRGPACSSPARRPGPETIDDSIAQGQAAALAALTLGGACSGQRRPSDVCDCGAKPRRCRRRRPGSRPVRADGCAAPSTIWPRPPSRPAASSATSARWRSRPRCSSRCWARARVDLTETEFLDLVRLHGPGAPPDRPGCWPSAASRACARVIDRPGAAALATADARLAAFVAAFPQDRAHRWVRDLGAEILHFTAPDQLPLMTRWVWDAGVGTGVLREIWHADDVDAAEITVADDMATFATLRGEIEGFWPTKACSATCLWYADLLLAHVYAGYINDRGGQYLRTDFTIEGDPMLHTRRMLGLDAVDTETGRTRLRLIDGSAHDSRRSR